MKNINCFKYIAESKNTSSSGESADKNFKMGKDISASKTAFEGDLFFFFSYNNLNTKITFHITITK